MSQNQKELQAIEKGHQKEYEKLKERQKTDLTYYQKKQRKDLETFAAEVKKVNKNAKGALEDRVKKLVAQKEKVHKQAQKDFKGGKQEASTQKQEQKDGLENWTKEVMQLFNQHQEAVMNESKYTYEKKELVESQDLRLKLLEEV